MIALVSALLLVRDEVRYRGSQRVQGQIPERMTEQEALQAAREFVRRVEAEEATDR